MRSVLQNPVFVVGVFRSGTSLLYALLNEHPEIALMYESDFWNFPDFFSKMRFRGNWLERQEFYNQTLSRHRLIYGGSLRGLENHRTPTGIYRAFSDGKGAAWCGEKSPFYCTRLRQIAQRHPQSPFVLIWRDPIEVFRSTIDAGQKVPFFRQSGMLTRMIYSQEKMIRQAAELERSGARIHHVRYDNLVDDTEKVCRGICEFLGIEFTPKMLELHNADLSAVYRTANFDHLRRGVVERRKSTTVIEPQSWKKLQRYAVRWHHLNENNFKNGYVSSEPSILELATDRIAGRFWHAKDGLKRLLFEFLPLPWLRMYRQTKKWYLSRRAELPADARSFVNQLRTHWVTIAASYLAMGGLATIHFFCNPRFTFLPFYLLPCAALTLIINRRWGSFAALIASFIGPALLSRADTDFTGYTIFIWNWMMRFVLLEIIIRLLDRVRVEAALTNEEK